jgi:hypothetical protein
MTWEIGNTSKKYEVGQGGPGTVSTGQGDHGGVSYGQYQLSSKMGTAAKFVEMMGYKQYFNGAAPGTSKFSSLWIKRASEDPKFGQDQHEFIRRTHYVPQIKLLQQKGIDLSLRGPAVQDAVWSTSVQFGGGTTLILRALSSKRPVDKLSDVEIVTLIQDYKIANNNTLFKSSSPAVRAGTLNRAKSEKNDLIKLANQSAVTPKKSKSESEENNPVIAAIGSFFDSMAAKGNS